MTVDEVKKELKRVGTAKRNYRLADDRASEFEYTLMGGKTAACYGDNGKTREKKGNPVENAYCGLIALKDEKERYRAEYIAAVRRAHYLIDLVSDPVWREVLDRRYFRGQHWEDISREMNYSQRHILRFHGWALSEISKRCH